MRSDETDEPRTTTEAGEPGTLTRQSLQAALEAVTRRREVVSEQIKALQRDAARAEQEESLLRRLIAVRDGERPEESVIPAEREQRSVANDAWATPNEGSSSHPVVDEVLSLLHREQRPLHVSELMRALRQRRIRLPGAGTEANVISHLTRDRRISRPSRGIYALADWRIEYEEPTIVPRRKRRAKTVSRLNDEERNAEGQT